MIRCCWYTALCRRLRAAAVTLCAYLVVLVMWPPAIMKFALPDVVMPASTSALGHPLPSSQSPSKLKNAISV